MPTHISKKSQKLVLVLATSILVIEDSKEAILVDAKGLEHVIYIQYFIVFQDCLT